MGDTFQNHVYVSNPETGDAAWFAPGDEAPEWTEGYVDPVHFEEKEEPAEPGAEQLPAERPNYSRMKKEELIDLADERDLDTEGTVADLIARLEENDAALR